MAEEPPEGEAKVRTEAPPERPFRTAQTGPLLRGPGMEGRKALEARNPGAPGEPEKEEGREKAEA